ncbi:hypothetical protein pb186bvf_012210 [Paramecium bursaria]
MIKKFILLNMQLEILINFIIKLNQDGLLVYDHFLQQIYFSLILINHFKGDALMITLNKIAQNILLQQSFGGFNLSDIVAIIILISTIIAIILMVVGIVTQITYANVKKYLKIQRNLIIYITFQQIFENASNIYIINLTITFIMAIFSSIYDLRLNSINQGQFTSYLTNIIQIIIILVSQYKDYNEVLLIIFMVYDSYLVGVVILLQQYRHQQYKLEQFQFILSFTRFFISLLLLNNVQKGIYLMLIISIIIKMSSLVFQSFIRYEIQKSIIMLNESDLNQILSRLIILKMVAQLSQEQILYYNCQLLGKHSRVCEDTLCFCNNVEPNQQYSQQITQEVSIQMIDNLLTQNIHSSFDNSIIEELIFVLSQLEVTFKTERLFQTLIRYSIIQKRTQVINNQYFYKLRPSYIRCYAFQEQVQIKIGQYLNQNGFDINQYAQFSNLVEEIGAQMIELCVMKYQILDLLNINYQNPLFYLLDNLSQPFVKLSRTTKLKIDELINIYPDSISVNILVTAFYQFIHDDIVALKKYKKKVELFQIINIQKAYENWKLISQNKACFIVASFEKDKLIFKSHSSLFPQIYGVLNCGIHIDWKRSRRYYCRSNQRETCRICYRDLIKTGIPTLLQKQLMRFMIKDVNGYLKEVFAIIRLKTNGQELQFMMLMIHENEKSSMLLLNSQNILQEYSQNCDQQLKLEKGLSKLVKERLKYKSSKFDILKNKGFLQQNCNLVDFSLFIPQLRITDEIINGIILIPKSIQSQVVTESQFNIQNMKYYLSNPNQCYVFVTVYKLRKMVYNSDFTYSILQIFNSRELQGKDLKIYGLEILLRQFMMQQNIKSETYQGFHSNYSKHLETNIKSNETSYSYQDSWPEDLYQMEESDHYKILFPQPNSVRLFPESSQLRDLDLLLYEDNEGKFHNINPSVPSSFMQFSDKPSLKVNQDQLTDERLKGSSKTLQNESYEDNIKEQRYQIEINVENYTDQQIMTEIEWVRQKLKLREQKKFKKIEMKTKEIQNLDENKSSIRTENSSNNSTLVYHIIQNVINTNPRDLYGLYFFQVSLLLAVTILIITNILLLSQNYRQLYLYSQDKIYPLNQIFYLSIMSFSMQKLNFLQNSANISDPQYISNDQNQIEETLSFFINFTSQAFYNSTIQVNYNQSYYHQFLDVINGEQILINLTDTDRDQEILQVQYEKRYFITKHLLNTVIDIAAKDPQMIRIKNLQESTILYNFEQILSSFMELIDSTDQEVYNSISYTENIIQLFLGLGLGISILIMLLILNQIKRIYEWRSKIVTTYFLFQTLSQQMQELDQIFKTIIGLDEFREQNHAHLIKNVNKGKSEINSIKSGQRQQDSKLKIRKVLETLFLQSLVLFLFLAYIIPFSIYISNESSNSVTLNGLISHLGRAKCDFPADFTLFLSQAIPMFDQSYYPNNYSEKINDIYDIFMPTLDTSYYYLTTAMPYQSQFQGSDFKQLIDFFQGDICEQIKSPHYQQDMGVNPNISQCRLALDGQLKNGYTALINYYLPKLNNWEFQIYDFNDSQFARQIVIYSEEFNQLMEGYSFVLPLIQFVQKNLIELLDSLNQQVIVNAQIITIVSLCIIIIAEILIARTVFNRVSALIDNTRQLLLIFNKTHILRNRHLMQILQKQVTI